MNARLILDWHFPIGGVNNRLFGVFVEHMGRSIYHGLYEPGHPEADEDGFRKDVMKLASGFKSPIIRYPGGNFVSGYRWEDGIGKKEERPSRTDVAWHSIESNEIGIHEFVRWVEKIDSSVMMAVNLGTRGAEDAKNLLEYCNFPKGTYYSDLRRKNGREEPFDIRVWCLGNEMDGPWQIGARNADAYGRLAYETGALMKRMDPSLELVVCGSSSEEMPTFGAWETTVLEHTYEIADYISLHRYFGNSENDTASYLGCAQAMDRFIHDVTSICDSVKAVKRSRKTINLSFDEWNVWSASSYKKGYDDPKAMWVNAPIREEYSYSLEDALAFGCLIITLLKNCDRVKMACLAQLINVAAPIMTENYGSSWAQTTYYPFQQASLFGRGLALKPVVECEHYITEKYGDVSYLESVAVFHEEESELVVFAVNRSLTDEIYLTVVFRDINHFELLEHIVLNHDDLGARNDRENPRRVLPYNRNEIRVEGGCAVLKLEKHSWNTIRLRVR